MTGQATVPDESRVNVSVHGFWKWGTTALFDMLIFHLHAGSYLRQTSAKALVTVDKDKNDRYLQPCLERRRSFTPMMHSTDGIPGTEAVAAQRRLSLLLSNNLKQEYSEICVYVRARISLAVVRSNTLLLHGAMYKGAYIH